MSDTETPKIDLSKVTVGTFANLGGQPVDYAKTAIYARAGIPISDERVKALVYTHASMQGKAVPRLPDPFPPAEMPEGQELQTAQDYLDLIAATPVEYVATPPEAAADQRAAAEARALAQAAEQQAAEKEAAERKAEELAAKEQAENQKEQAENQAGNQGVTNQTISTGQQGIDNQQDQTSAQDHALVTEKPSAGNPVPENNA